MGDSFLSRAPVGHSGDGDGGTLLLKAAAFTASLVAWYYLTATHWGNSGAVYTQWESELGAGAKCDEEDHLDGVTPLMKAFNR